MKRIRQGAEKVVVTLGFDDGRASHRNAQRLLDAHGLSGTFYVNSARLGEPQYLTLDEVHGLQDGGHEVGGHTLDHVDLPLVDPVEQRRQITEDRAQLVAWDLRAESFAYPFGRSTRVAREAVTECGYKTGRIVGGLPVSTPRPFAARAEKLPPRRAAAVRTPGYSLKHTHSLEYLQALVKNAENRGKGWAHLVFHDIAERSDHACWDDVYSVTPTMFEAFVSWLAARETRGTVVRTAAAAVSG